MKTKESIIDWDYINAIFNNNVEEIQEFLQDYENISEVKIKQLELAIREKDQKKAKEILHFLKGSSGFIKKIHHYCLHAEDTVNRAEWNDVESTYLQLKHSFQLLKKEIKKNNN